MTIFPALVAALAEPAPLPDLVQSDPSSVAALKATLDANLSAWAPLNFPWDAEWGYKLFPAHLGMIDAWHATRDQIYLDHAIAIAERHIVVLGRDSDGDGYLDWQNGAYENRINHYHYELRGMAGIAMSVAVVIGAEGLVSSSLVSRARSLVHELEQFYRKFTVSSLGNYLLPSYANADAGIPSRQLWATHITVGRACLFLLSLSRATGNAGYRTSAENLHATFYTAEAAQEDASNHWWLFQWNRPGADDLAHGGDVARWLFEANRAGIVADGTITKVIANWKARVWDGDATNPHFTRQIDGTGSITDWVVATNQGQWVAFALYDTTVRDVFDTFRQGSTGWKIASYAPHDQHVLAYYGALMRAFASPQTL